MAAAVTKPRRPLPRRQLMFAAVLFLLGVLVILLWFAKPDHRFAGPSRIEWPPPAAAKP